MNNEINNNQVVQQPVEQPVQPVVEPPVPNKKKGKGVLITIILIVLIFAIAAVAVVVLTNKETKEDNNTTTTTTVATTTPTKEGFDVLERKHVDDETSSEVNITKTLTFNNYPKIVTIDSTYDTDSGIPDLYIDSKSNISIDGKYIDYYMCSSDFEIFEAKDGKKYLIINACTSCTYLGNKTILVDEDGNTIVNINNNESDFIWLFDINGDSKYKDYFTEKKNYYVKNGEYYFLEYVEGTHRIVNEETEQYEVELKVNKVVFENNNYNIVEVDRIIGRTTEA